MNNKQWLEKLQPGDTVIVDGHWTCRIAKIDRMTKTQFIMESGSRFRRKDGWQVGGSTYSRCYLREPTEERLNEIKHQTLAKDLSNVKWKELDLLTLQNVWGLLP